MTDTMDSYVLTVEAPQGSREEEPMSSDFSSISSKLSQSEQLLLSLSSESVLKYSSDAKIQNT
jgi:hypothetical protein